MGLLGLSQSILVWAWRAEEGVAEKTCPHHCIPEK